MPNLSDLSAVLRPVASAHGLPNAHYTCAETFQALLEQIEWSPERDALWLAGNFTPKGGFRWRTGGACVLTASSESSG